MLVQLTIISVVLTASAVDSQNTNAGRYQTVIVVNAENGTNNISCWNNSFAFPCRTLNFALKGAQSSNSTKILLEAGGYELYPDPNVTEFRWAVDIALVGSSSTDLSDSNDTPREVSVTCLPGAGLAFFNSDGISIENIKFSECGMIQVSTSRNFSDEGMPYVEFLTAFYFLFCRDVSLTRVTITQSNGIGMIMYATVGDNNFHHCNFSFNSVNDTDIPGGGGLYIEFPYCTPGDLDCTSGPSNISSEFSSDATYSFDRCSFENNTASNGNELSCNIFTYVLTKELNNYPFGRGGGLSVFFNGNSTNINIAVSNSTVHGNEAIWGAGVFVEFQDFSANNTFSMYSSSIEENYCHNNADFNEGTGGGGVRLGYILYHGNSAISCLYNHILFESCSFDKNVAHFGGGVSFFTARENCFSGYHSTNTLEFRNCQWESNDARLGSAVDLAVWHPVTEGTLVHAKFTDCNFSNHLAYDEKFSGYVGVGTFFSDSIPVEFSGNILFERNSQSALVVTAATVGFRDNTIANFIGNFGRNGGAIQILAYASIRVHSNTIMNFINNTALYNGGAIYAFMAGEHDLLASLNCFIRYRNFVVPPWDWNTTFNFEGNMANGGNNSIHGTSVFGCVWGGWLGQTDEKEVFCWGDQWNYNGNNCTDEVSTEPTQFHYNELESFYSLSAFPGRETKLPVKALDDFGRIIREPQVYGIQLVSGDAKTNGSYIVNDNVAVYGRSNSTTKFALETSSPKVLRTELVVELLPCPPGFILDNDSRCVCGDSYRGLVTCFEVEFNSQLRQGGWMGDISGDVLAGNNPYSPGSLFVKYIQLPRLTSDLDEKICGPLDRTGVLCGECIDGYSTSFASSSFDCVPCTSHDGKYHWVFYMLAKFLPLTVLLAFVLIFHISATQGPAYAFIFFAQILASNINLGGQLAQSIQVHNITNVTANMFFRNVYTVVYSIANLNFFEPFLPTVCLSPNFDTMKLIALTYIVAAYPLMVLVFIFFIVKLYEKGIKPVYQIVRPIDQCFALCHRKWNIKHSIFDAFTTFIILSYTKFIFTSFYFLIPAYLYNDVGDQVGTGVLYYNGKIKFLHQEHLPYFLTALCVVFVFAVILPLLLLVYPLKLIGACMGWTPGSKMSQILDAFQGCYKNGTNNTNDCRYFAGLYLIVRIVLFVIFVSTTPNWFLQFLLKQFVYMCAILLFLIVRPYKEDFYNKFDAIIFATLATINTFNVYINSLTAFGTQQAWPVVLQYILIYCPLVYMIGYVLSQIRVMRRFALKCYEAVKGVGTKLYDCLKCERLQYQPIQGNNTSNGDLRSPLPYQPPTYS